MFCSLFFIFSAASAQRLQVDVRIDSTMLWIGQQTDLTFEISQQAEQKVTTPLFSDTIVGGLELVKRHSNDTTKTDNENILVKQRYTLTSFEDSLFYIPPFPFVSDEDTFWTKSLSLKVVQPFEIDTTENAIFDIKQVYTPPVDIKEFFKTLLMILLGIAVCVGVFLLIRYFVKKPKVTEEKIAPELLRPAHEVALEKLEKIRTEKRWQKGKVKEYQTELTEVLREYIERVFDISAMEMTSDEILDQMNGLRIENKPIYQDLAKILRLADLVKFAKWTTTPDENESSLKKAFGFVEATKVEEEQTVEETDNTAD